MYLPTAGIPGSLSAADFKGVGAGVCKPTNWDALDAIKEMQRQLNRAAQAKGLAKIEIDGDVGPATSKLVMQTGPYMMVDSANCESISINALIILAQAKGYANQAGVPAQITQPQPRKAPSIVAPTGAIVTQPLSASAMDSFKNMSTTTMLLLGAGAVGVGYFITRKKKGRR